MKLSLDTSTIVNVLRDSSSGARAHFRTARASRAPLVLSSLVLYELDFGATISGRPALHRQRYRELVDGLPVEVFDAGDAIAAAEVRHRLRAAGHNIGAVDTLIAGQALARGWSVVTADVKDFGRIDHLAVIDWSS